MQASSKAMIELRNVSKNFRRWLEEPKSIKSLLVKSSKLQRSFEGLEETTVLDALSFDIHPGEFVGIMGRNGSGKSTLVKMMAGIYTPSQGHLSVAGRIGPLIEVGAGFDGELSGLENIYLNAAVLGFGRQATKDALPEVMAFAELGEKIHMPVRKYSSGMVVRLGFAVVTHLEAPILIIDEVLAVGDIGFQRKCLAKIHELHKKGRTIVLVTHDPSSVARHCTRALVLDQGRLRFDGSPSEGAAYYRGLFNPVETSKVVSL
jgi:ABC-type polysaccharide/polyol phosphate transport system ATPase subunit